MPIQEKKVRVFNCEMIQCGKEVTAVDSDPEHYVLLAKIESPDGEVVGERKVLACVDCKNKFQKAMETTMFKRLRRPRNDVAKTEAPKEETVKKPELALGEEAEEIVETGKTEVVVNGEEAEDADGDVFVDPNDEDDEDGDEFID